MARKSEESKSEYLNDDELGFFSKNHNPLSSISMSTDNQEVDLLLQKNHQAFTLYNNIKSEDISALITPKMTKRNRTRNKKILLKK